MTAPLQARLNELRDLKTWDRGMYGSPMHPYQLEFAQAAEPLIDDCLNRRLASCTSLLMISRQGGKNETFGRLEARSMCRYAHDKVERNIVKSAPTFKPQLCTSMLRLERCLSIPILQVTKKGKVAWAWRKMLGYKFVLGNAVETFLSGDPVAARVSETVSLFMVIDEMQSYDRDVYRLEMRPMLASTNAAVLACGTSWINNNLIEEEREKARQLQKKLNRRLLFEYPWWKVAEFNPAYAIFAESEKNALGEKHVVWLSQYCLTPVAAVDSLFSKDDLELMRGKHPRQRKPVAGEVYVAGIDLNGLTEQDPEEMLKIAGKIKRDSTVVTICALKYRLSQDKTRALPFLRVVAHLYIKDEKVETAVDRISAFLELWQIRRAVVDAKGCGRDVAAKLVKRFHGRVVGLKSTLDDVTRMAFGLMAAAQTGMIKMYTEEGLSGVELEAYQEFWLQAAECKRELLGDEKCRFEAPTTYVDGKPVHDDFPKSLGYAWEAGSQHLQSHYTPPSPEEDEGRWRFGVGHAA